MINLNSDVQTICLQEVVDTLKQFADNGGYDTEELLYFASQLTGASVDALAAVISE